jgi:pSer/pThr/pTyr-binding forkhead associated (FHA) protein
MSRMEITVVNSETSKIIGVSSYAEGSTSIKIGRSKKADIVIDERHSSVSSYHLEVCVNNTIIQIKDGMGERPSTNGTYINQLRITSNRWVRISDEQKISLGNPMQRDSIAIKISIANKASQRIPNVDYSNNLGTNVNLASTLNLIPNTRFNRMTREEANKIRKSAGILALLFGAISLHKLVLKQYGNWAIRFIGCFLLALPSSFISILILFIIATVEGIKYLTMPLDEFIMKYIEGDCQWL